MVATRNEKVYFNALPTGFPEVGKTLKKVTEEIDLDAELKDGEVLVKTVALSLDPYLKGRMRPEEIESYVPAFKLHEPIVNIGVGKVIKSKSSEWKVGDHLYHGQLEFAEYKVYTDEFLQGGGGRKLENKEGLAWSTWTGAAGMPGSTAWYGLEKIAKPQKGETIFISAASGAVGQMVGALALKAGLKVIGSAGSDEKVAFLKDELKFDVAFNYKTQSTADILSQHKFDIYWDNVGGETLDIALNKINKRGRIVACGASSTYNGETYGVKNTYEVVAKELLFQGFIVLYHDTSEFFRTVPQEIADGKILFKEHVYKGFDNGEAFLDLMKGGNFGKSVIVLDD